MRRPLDAKSGLRLPACRRQLRHHRRHVLSRDTLSGGVHRSLLLRRLLRELDQGPAIGPLGRGFRRGRERVRGRPEGRPRRQPVLPLTCHPSGAPHRRDPGREHGPCRRRLREPDHGSRAARGHRGRIRILGRQRRSLDLRLGLRRRIGHNGDDRDPRVLSRWCLHPHLDRDRPARGRGAGHRPDSGGPSAHRHGHAAAHRRQLPGGRHHLVRWPGIGRRGWDAGPGRLQLDRAVPPRRTHPSARRSHHERQQRKVRHPHHRRDQRQRVVPDLPDAHRRVGAAHDAHARRAARQGDLQARDRPAGVRAHAGRPAGCDAADRHGRRGDRAYPGCPVAADGRGTGVRLRIVVRWRRRDAQHQHTRGEYDLPRDVSRGAGGDWRRRRHHVDHRRQPRFRRLRRGGG